MKKFLIAALALTMILSQSVCALAATQTDTIDALPGTSEGTVEVYESNNSTKATVYSVTIDWTETAMNYEVTGEKVWVPESHSYDESAIVKEWKDKDATINVTNHSNADITASIAADTDNVLSYTFDKDNFSLVSAEGTEVENAPTDYFMIYVDESNFPDGNITEKFTVTIEATPAEPETIELSFKDETSLSGKNSSVTVLLPDGYTTDDVTYDVVGGGAHCAVSTAPGSASNEIVITHTGICSGSGAGTLTVTSIANPEVEGTISINCAG